MLAEQRRAQRRKTKHKWFSVVDVSRQLTFAASVDQKSCQCQCQSENETLFSVRSIIIIYQQTNTLWLSHLPVLRVPLACIVGLFISIISGNNFLKHKFIANAFTTFSYTNPFPFRPQISLKKVHLLQRRRLR